MAAAQQSIKDLIQRDGWAQLYTEIRRDSSVSEFPALEAAKPENRTFNRYRDVYPYDHSRVKLEDLDHTDYINASLVKSIRANRNYILSQGPLPATVGHFWLTVWQQMSKAVLMLNRVLEKGQLKCHQYWPQDVGDDLIFEDVQLKLENIQSEPGEHYTVRTFRISKLDTDESREIKHFHYTTWPDFGVPKCPDTFLEFLTVVRESGVLDPDVGPSVVHCSAGIGRSGTFCLVDTCLVLIEKEGFENVNIKEVLLELRSYRMGLIQTPDQLKFSYLAIIEGARQRGLISNDILADLQCQRAPTSSEISDDEDEQDVHGGGPPPLPPPRNESLRQQLQDILCNNHTNNGVFPKESIIPDQLSLAPSQSNGHGQNTEPVSNGGNAASPKLSDSNCSAHPTASCSSSTTSSTSSCSSSSSNPARHKTESTCILNNHKMEERKREMEIRRRNKEARQTALQSKVQDMKRKSADSEDWKRRKSQVYEMLPFCFGLVMMVAAGSYYFLKG